MHGIEIFLGYVWTACFVGAFLVEIALNRRPWVVAFAVPGVLYLMSLAYVWMSDGVLEPITVELGAILFFIPGLIGSLMGSGTARGLRIWFAFWWDEWHSQDRS